jgi:hypothetical protein
MNKLHLISESDFTYSTALPVLSYEKAGNNIFESQDAKDACL